MTNRPCKVCGHVPHPVDNELFHLRTCKEAKCKCVWYTSLDNLEYLEWLDKQHEKAS